MFWLCTLGSVTQPVSAAPAKAAVTPGICSAHVVNHCDFPVWLWSMGEVTGSRVHLNPGKSYHEPYHTSSTIGTSIKISRVDNLFEGKPVEQLEYTVADRKVFYDLSLINGDLFAAEGVELVPSDHSCPTVNSGNAYHHPDDVANKACKIQVHMQHRS
ncbi:MAG: hypothetical protein MMC23_002743 [Stictis urceolatum]|nr:hypothetical protein [Stictis urceolata]